MCQCQKLTRHGDGDRPDAVGGHETPTEALGRPLLVQEHLGTVTGDGHDDEQQGASAERPDTSSGATRDRNGFPLLALFPSFFFLCFPPSPSPIASGWNGRETISAPSDQEAVAAAVAGVVAETEGADAAAAGARADVADRDHRVDSESTQRGAENKRLVAGTTTGAAK